LRSTESATGYTSGASAQLEAAVAECSSQAKALKDFLKALEVDVLLTSRDGDYAESRTKAGQFEKAKKDLQAAVREFENVYPLPPQSRFNFFLGEMLMVGGYRRNESTVTATMNSSRGNTASSIPLQQRKKSNMPFPRERHKYSRKHY
jgi:hypothetical protein